jgi:hypothetical protein
MKSAREKNYIILERARNRGINLDFNAINTLRRAELTLHRWFELECGDGNDYASWSLERDEKTDKPYKVVYPHDSNKVRRYLVPDREKGAMRRVESLCKEKGLYFFVQTDPRGCALYINNEPLTDSDYDRGVSMCD